MTLQLIDIGRDYAQSGSWAVDNVSLKIQPGQIAAVLGANGAGKSTLLRLIAGWLPLATGRIAIQGRTLRIRSADVRRRLMLLDGQAAQALKTEDLVCQTIDDYRIDRPAIAKEVADWFDRLELIGCYGKRINALSRGQAFKVALVCLFVVCPHLWLLDEPFSAGLDANGMNHLQDQMRLQAKRGGIVLFTSQWPRHANRMADESFVLHEGRLVHHQTPASSIAPQLVKSAPASLAAVLNGLRNES